MTGSALAAECPMPGLRGGARRFMSKSLKEVFTVKRKEGFTLVELLVVILCCAIVTAAAMTLLFTGVRVENAAVNTSQEQQNARILLRTLEDLCSSGKINRIEQSYTGWSVGTEAQGAFSPLLTYVASAQELRTGTARIRTPCSFPACALPPSAWRAICSRCAFTRRNVF